MSTKGFASFLSTMGYQVRTAAGVYWYNEHPHIYTSFPFHQCVNPRGLVFKEVLGRDGWALRYPCEIAEGRKSYRLACAVPDYGMRYLSGKARNQTRRGLEQCLVREVTFTELAQQALRLNRETLARQKRSLPADFEGYWRRYFTAASQAEGACAWGAFAGEALAAYLIAFEMESIAHVLIVRSSTEHLKIYPNNALLYGFLQHALNRGRYREVSIGFESIRRDLRSLDHFKLGMGFSRIEIGQRVELAPALARLLPIPVLSGLLRVSPVWQHGEVLDKLAGLLEWYRDQQCR